MADRASQRLADELDLLRSRSEFRCLESMGAANFCSNDYLGLAEHPELGRAVSNAIAQCGRVASTGSRLLSGHVPAWEALEAEFASWIGADAALFFSSGYAANTGLLGSILRDSDVVFSDSANHASLIDGLRLSKARRVIFPHMDLGALEEALKSEKDVSGERFVVFESIFSMDGDRSPIADLSMLADRYDAHLIVDEAHATGVSGPEGRGEVAAADRPGNVFATVHTCGKALASAGAFVVGAQTLKDFLINRARTLIFSTALPPYMAAQIHAAIRLVRRAGEKRALLSRMAEDVRRRLRDGGIDCAQSDSQIIPVMLGTNEEALRVSNILQQKGLLVRAIRPPTVPEGTSRLRLSLNTTIPLPVIDELVDALAAILAEVK